MAPQTASEAQAQAAADLVASLGGDALGSALLRFLHTLADFDSGFILFYHQQRTPTVLAEALDHPARRNDADAYLAGAYLLDPFRIHAETLVAPAVVRLDDIAAADFRAGEYFRSYYVHSHLADEVNLLVPVAPKQVVATCVGRSQAMAPFANAELAPFHRWLAFVAAILHRHLALRPTDPAASPQGAEPEHLRLEARLAAFGAGVLTPREREVVQLLLRGRSAAEIAGDLHVSVQTVRVHRRNIYEKLEVSSLGQLFSLATRALLGETSVR